IDRLFRDSKLMRGKWDAPRGESTYGRLTIAEALAQQTEHYTPPPTLVVSPAVPAAGYVWGAPGSRNGSTPATAWGAESVWDSAIPVGEFLAQQDEEHKPYVRDLLFPGAITVVAAPRGSYKTLTTLALAIALASGGRFRAEQVPQLRVLL